MFIQNGYVTVSQFHTVYPLSLNSLISFLLAIPQLSAQCKSTKGHSIVCESALIYGIWREVWWHNWWVVHLSFFSICYPPYIVPQKKASHSHYYIAILLVCQTITRYSTTIRVDSLVCDICTTWAGLLASWQLFITSLSG